MALIPASVEQVVDRLGLGDLHLGRQGATSRAALARLLRSAAARWGRTPRADLLAMCRDVQESLGVSTAERLSGPDLLDDLIRVGDLIELERGPASLRLIQGAAPAAVAFGDQQGARWLVLGVTQTEPVSDEPLSVFESGDRHTHTRWSSLARWCTEEPVGLAQLTLRDWVAGVASPPTPSSQWTPVLGREHLVEALWSRACGRLETHGAPVDRGAELYGLRHAPGAYPFGHAPLEDAATPGRWADAGGLKDGVYPALRRGPEYRRGGQPCVARVDGGRWAAMWDLPSRDDLWWCMLGRAAQAGVRERLVVRQDQVKRTTPLPAAARRVIDLCAVDAPTRWSRAMSTSDEALLLAGVVAEVCGLELLRE